MEAEGDHIESEGSEYTPDDGECSEDDRDCSSHHDEDDNEDKDDNECSSQPIEEKGDGSSPKARNSSGQPGRPISRSDRRNTRRRERYREEACVDEFMRKADRNDPDARNYFEAHCLTKAGSRRFRTLRSLIQSPQNVDAELRKNVKRVLDGTGGHLRSLLEVKFCTRPATLHPASTQETPPPVQTPATEKIQTNPEIAKVLGLKPGDVTRSANRTRKQKSRGEATLKSNYPSNNAVKKTYRKPYESEMYVDFFHRHSVYFSGAGVGSDRLHTEIENYELEAELYAEIPTMLRDAGSNNPASLVPHKDYYTRLQASTLAAMWASEQDDFDLETEMDLRREKALQKYDAKKEVQKKARNRSRVRRAHIAKYRRQTPQPQDPQPTEPQDPQPTEPQPQEPQMNKQEGKQACKQNHKPDKALRMVGTFDPSQYEVRPRNMQTFWSILNDADVKYSYNVTKHPCPICDEGAVWQLLHAEAVTRLGRLELDESDAGYIEALREVRRTKFKVEEYALHMMQYEYCRDNLKEIEENLKPGELLIWRDFVNQHTYQNAKVSNLVLVLMWRDSVGGPVYILKINNVCADKDTNGTDSYFVADVFDNLFRSDFMTRFFVIYIAGDHGSHFCSTATFFNESTFRMKYGKHVVCLFLCSYHCYNRCDRAGLELKILAAIAFDNDRGPIKTMDFQRLMDRNRCSGSFVIPFLKINRPVDLIPANLLVIPKHLARKICEMTYCFRDMEDRLACEPGRYLYV